MDIFMYIILFMMGTVFGSFFTLAVYRIPLKKDITHERSFCPNCNHKLNFLDMIPILSYVFLKGKCRYCGEKIRIRYLCLEVLSGIVFLVAYLSLKIYFPFFYTYKFIIFTSFVFMYVTLAITAGIDKEYKSISTGVIIFGFAMQTIYYLYDLLLNKNYDTKMIHQICFIFIIEIILIIINKIMFKNREIKEDVIINKSPYILQILMLITYIMYFTNSYFLDFMIVLFVVIEIIIVYFIKGILCCIKKQGKCSNIDCKKYSKIPIGFYLCITTIACVILNNFMFIK